MCTTSFERKTWIQASTATDQKENRDQDKEMQKGMDAPSMVKSYINGWATYGEHHQFKFSSWKWETHPNNPNRQYAEIRKINHLYLKILWLIVWWIFYITAPPPNQFAFVCLFALVAANPGLQAIAPAAYYAAATPLASQYYAAPAAQLAYAAPAAPLTAYATANSYYRPAAALSYAAPYAYNSYNYKPLAYSAYPAAYLH